MIGKLVEHILEAGFSVHVQKNKWVTILRMYEVVGDVRCAVDWALPHEDFVMPPEVILLDECNQRLQLLRDEITKRQMEKSE